MTISTNRRDNSSFDAKLCLRRCFLRRYHYQGAIHVLDCCQGEGHVWKALREEFELATYLGLDLKPKPGRLKIDSARFLQQPGWPQNVVDIDTYGSPWRHWTAMLPNVVRPTTVFLTIGTVMAGATDGTSLHLLGLDRFRKRKIPIAFWPKLSELSVQRCLAEIHHCGLDLVECRETRPTPRVRYIGLHLRPGE